MMLQLTVGDVRRLREAAAATMLATPGEHAAVDVWHASGAAAVRALFAADRLLWLLPPCGASEATLAPTDQSDDAATAGPTAGPTAPCFSGDGLREAEVAVYETFRTRAPGRDALLCVGERGGASGRFSGDDALAVAELLWPAFVAGVRAALARWGTPDPEPHPVVTRSGGPLGVAPASGAARLTAREREVAALLAARRTNAEVAVALGVTTHTARHHTQRVLRKLGCRSRREVSGYSELHHVV